MPLVIIAVLYPHYFSDAGRRDSGQHPRHPDASICWFSELILLLVSSAFLLAYGHLPSTARSPYSVIAPCALAAGESAPAALGGAGGL
ncbi:hypothetical protein DSL92_03265 [Billgrantia gudaonensis]|uniref:Uncharacterized protein n=1 Tax=Billgrantia gudaonensis TaxID=376427 RepID=A0A3S0QG77_9GAMM|nr:hypothetical protein DSL92_03265 [Halomonas gudaonensis]